MLWNVDMDLFHLFVELGDNGICDSSLGHDEENGVSNGFYSHLSVCIADHLLRICMTADIIAGTVNIGTFGNSQYNDLMWGVP